MPHMLVRIRTRTAFFRVGFLAICLNVKYLSRDGTGRLLKSPYLLRARTRVVLRWSKKRCYSWVEVCRLHRQSNRRKHDPLDFKFSHIKQDVDLIKAQTTLPAYRFDHVLLMHTRQYRMLHRRFCRLAMFR